MKKLIFAAALAVLLPACASTGMPIDQAAIDQVVIGKTTKDDMMTLFGPPLSQSFDSDGKLMFSWIYVHVGPFGSNMQNESLIALIGKDGTVEKFNVVKSGGIGTRLGY